MSVLRKTLLATSILLATAIPGISLAEEKTVEVPPPPALPEGADNEESMEADVVIRKGKDKVIEEFRVNGELYMVRITPKIGKPYYIRYPDGDKAHPIRKELNDINTPYWKLFEW